MDGIGNRAVTESGSPSSNTSKSPPRGEKQKQTVKWNGIAKLKRKSKKCNKQIYNKDDFNFF